MSEICFGTGGWRAIIGDDFIRENVNRVAQAISEILIEDKLTEEEKAIYRRGRNAKSHAPRSASVAEYHASTGFEALLGSLYLSEQNERLYEIAEMSFQIISQAMMKEIREKKS